MADGRCAWEAHSSSSWDITIYIFSRWWLTTILDLKNAVYNHRASEACSASSCHFFAEIDHTDLKIARFFTIFLLKCKNLIDDRCLLCITLSKLFSENLKGVNFFWPSVVEFALLQNQISQSSDRSAKQGPLNTVTKMQISECASGPVLGRCRLVGQFEYPHKRRHSRWKLSQELKGK